MVHPDPHHPGISALVSSPSVSGSASASYIASSVVLAICLVDTVLSIFFPPLTHTYFSTATMDRWFILGHYRSRSTSSGYIHRINAPTSPVCIISGAANSDVTLFLFIKSLVAVINVSSVTIVYVDDSNISNVVVVCANVVSDISTSKIVSDTSTVHKCILVHARYCDASHQCAYQT